VNEICERNHVEYVVLVVVGGSRHKGQPREEEGQGGAEGVAQLAVHQQAAQPGFLAPPTRPTLA
jgi:hypothetical protein